MLRADATGDVLKLTDVVAAKYIRKLVIAKKISRLVLASI